MGKNFRAQGLNLGLTPEKQLLVVFIVIIQKLVGTSVNSGSRRAMRRCRCAFGNRGGFFDKDESMPWYSFDIAWVPGIIIQDFANLFDALAQGRVGDNHLSP